MSARGLLYGLLFGVACAIGCSWLIDPSDPHPLCSIGELGAPNVCPRGLQCRDGRCNTPCDTSVPDVCGDNIDNDCDDKVDEIDPEGRDTCGDGRDNDCNGLIDEVSASAPLCDLGSVCVNQRCIVPSCVNEGATLRCAPSERCEPTTGKCVSKQCADVTCAAMEYCDETTKTCVKKQPLQNGEPCSASADCASESCIDAAALRIASSARVCGKACCNDKQCGPGEHCFASGTGARSCLPIARLPEMAERECSTEDACGGTERCALSNDKVLSPPTFITREKVITSTCQPDVPGLLQAGERCVFFTDCASRACVPVAFGSLCSNPCGSFNDCRTLAARAGGLGAYCRYVDVTLAADSPVDYAPICVVPRIGELGSGEFGEECTKASDCREAGCVGATSTTKGRCTPSCCDDSQCGPREDSAPIRCRPFAFGSRYEMRCDI